MRKTKQAQNMKRKAELAEARTNVLRNYRDKRITMSELKAQLKAIDAERAKIK